MTKMDEDLARSGLVAADLNARLLDGPERTVAQVPGGVDGYVIPYYTIAGNIQAFYRVRLFDYKPKYKQPQKTKNHVYFPPNFRQIAETRNYVIITEGEKKAAALCKIGVPACALGGVDSWRNRSISLPKTVELQNQGQDAVTAKLPPGMSLEEAASTDAEGFQDLVDYLVSTNKHIIIVYDSDDKFGLKSQVQRAAATLAFEFRFRGVAFDHIRQIVLPPKTDNDGHPLKVAVDDFIQEGGSDLFYQLIEHTLAKRSAFPRFPNIQEWLGKRLQRTRMSRKEAQQTSMALLSELDANGVRLRSEQEDRLYYFDTRTRSLIKTGFGGRYKDEIHEMPFGRMLYKRFGLSAADARVLQWLAAQFSGEDPIESVTPHKVFARPELNADEINYQINDGQFIRVTNDPEAPYEIFDNGEESNLFVSGFVEPIEGSDLLKALEEVFNQPMECWWKEALNEARLPDDDKLKTVTALLYYISPWLYRWNGIQLPVELILGEPGSGKSTLCALRQIILTGRPELKNAPRDIKDWHASISNSGGLHITDNVHITDKSLRQQLSDEICRLITDPNPHVEMRKYFTEADQIKLPITSVFAITAIEQPFHNVDLLQRAILLHFEKQSNTEEELSYESAWEARKISERGGRVMWLAHHLRAIHEFFKLVKTDWNPKYKAKHRLIHFEQSLMLMAKVFGIDGEWIPGHLSTNTGKQVSESDWVLEGLAFFAEQWRTAEKVKQDGAPKPFTSKTMADYFDGQEDYRDNPILSNARRLGRHLKAHKHTISSLTGITELDTYGNKQRYCVKPIKSL